MIKSAAIILTLAVIAAVLSAFFLPKRPAWYRVENPDDSLRSISLDQARKFRIATEQVLWVDARSRADYEKAHLKGAILLNTDDWGRLMFEQQDTLQNAMGHPVIVYCDGSACQKSKVIAERLRELLGLDLVYVLKGDWRNLEAKQRAE